ncbi:MAG: hypothetical protein CMJ40_06435 [Phycisphaerae bacterium]|nr:hypothetical protein [Phycisphaerae bacterium]
MTDGTRDNPDIEEIAAFARGELEDSVRCERIKNDSDAMELVRQIQTDDDFLTRLAGAWSEAPDGSGRGMPPSSAMVPGYRVLGELYRGGQGTVFRAIQERTKRTVALKVMHGGGAAPERNRARFAREVELIASMRHPNIVTVYDGGEFENGGFYIAMEFIRGVPLVRADMMDRNLNNQSITELVRTKLTQMAKICDAVQYAHLRGIIHRDLKPGNILIDRNGEPKVLDFGVAKVLGDNDVVDQTLTGEFVGTFAYASPEQVSGTNDQIDTRCDIYSLGVVLYEMLTGRFPYEISGPVSETIQNIIQAEPSPPSRLIKGLDADLDAIIATALAKDPDRRYQSAGSLAADIRRYLAGEPIEARRDSTAYLLSKLARRHRVPILAGFALVVSLAAVTIWMSLLYVRAVNAEQKAEAGMQAALDEADKRATVLEVFTDMIEAVRPERGESEDGREPTVREMLDLAAETIEYRAINRRDIVAAIQIALGRSYLSLGLPEQARVQAESALQITNDFEGSMQIAEAEELLGWLAMGGGTLDEATERFERVLEIREERSADDPASVARAMMALASVAHARRDYDQALIFIDKGLAILERDGIDDLDIKVPLLNHRVRVFFTRPSDNELDRKRDLEAAEQTALTARELCQDQGEDLPDLITPLNNLAFLAESRRDLEEAESLLREALRLCIRYYPENHMRIGGLQRSLGVIRQNRGSHVMAARDLEQAVGIYRTHPGRKGRSYLARTLIQGGVSLREIGDYGSALKASREAIETLRGLDPVDQYQLGLALGLEGTTLVDMAQFKQAIPHLMEAYDVFRSMQESGRRLDVILESKLECMASIVKAYEGLSMNEQADAWRKRLEAAREELVEEQSRQRS